jgi:CheY-like chemotaxis protein
MGEPDRDDPATILVVDDLPQNIRLVAAVLEPRGYEVVPATSGAAALARIQSDRTMFRRCPSECRVIRRVAGMKVGMSALKAQIESSGTDRSPTALWWCRPAGW